MPQSVARTEQQLACAVFARHIRTEIELRSGNSEGRKTVVFRKIRKVLDESGGWKRRGTKNVSLIVDALVAEGVHWLGDLQDDDLDDIVWFGLHPMPRRAPIGRLDSERALREYIERNYGALFETVRELEGLDLVAAELEYQTTPSLQRPDVVFVDVNGEFVVVELEVGDPRENSPFQILKYMNAAHARLGVLITARPSDAVLEENIREALAMMRPTKRNIWLVYELRSPEGKLSLRSIG